MSDTEWRKTSTDGRAYGRPQQHFDEYLARVGAGTPCGELMRRYWQPVGISAEITSERPKKVKVLGEDLVLFRDKRPRRIALSTLHAPGHDVPLRPRRAGRHPLLLSRLAVRRRGLALNNPASPRGEHRDNARQPWYPVDERYGLVLAYMGPPDKKPVLPRFDILEPLDAGESFRRSATSARPATPVRCGSLLLAAPERQRPRTLLVQVLHSTLSGCSSCPSSR